MQVFEVYEMNDGSIQLYALDSDGDVVYANDYRGNEKAAAHDVKLLLSGGDDSDPTMWDSNMEDDADGDYKIAKASGRLLMGRDVMGAVSTYPYTQGVGRAGETFLYYIPRRLEADMEMQHVKEMAYYYLEAGHKVMDPCVIWYGDDGLGSDGYEIASHLMIDNGTWSNRYFEVVCGVEGFAGLLAEAGEFIARK